MFDQRFINDKYHAYATMQRHQQFMSILKDALSILDIQFDFTNVLLFDYIFAQEYNYVNPVENDAAHFDRFNISEMTAAELIETLKLITNVKLDGALPVCGSYLTTYIGSLQINKFYIALFTPSEPYDTCTMSWSAYHQIYQFGYCPDVECMWVWTDANYNQSLDPRHYGFDSAYDDPYDVCTRVDDIDPMLNHQYHTYRLTGYGTMHLHRTEDIRERPARWLVGKSYLSDVLAI